MLCKDVFKKWAIHGPLVGEASLECCCFSLLMALKLPSLRTWLKTGESPFRLASVVLLFDLFVYIWFKHCLFELPVTLWASVNCLSSSRIGFLSAALQTCLPVCPVCIVQAMLRLPALCSHSAGSCRVSALGNASQVPATNPTSREGFSCSLSSENVLWCQSSKEASAASWDIRVASPVITLAAV